MKALFVIDGNIEDMSVDVELIAESELEGRKIVRNKLKPHEHKGKSTLDIRDELLVPMYYTLINFFSENTKFKTLRPYEGATYCEQIDENSPGLEEK